MSCLQDIIFTTREAVSYKLFGVICRGDFKEWPLVQAPDENQ